MCLISGPLLGGSAGAGGAAAWAAETVPEWVQARARALFCSLKPPVLSRICVSAVRCTTVTVGPRGGELCRRSLQIHGV